MLPLRDLNPSRTTPWVTWALMLACAVVFVLELAPPPWLPAGISMEALALVPARVTDMLASGPDALTIASVFTSMFVHGGLLHVAGNLWFLRIFGDNVEDHLGHARFLAFYLACGVAAAGAQWAVDPGSTVPMVGASGAIAGVLAAYLLLFPRARVVTVLPPLFWLSFQLPAFIVIIAWFGLQFLNGLATLGVKTAGGVAHWAHIGGFAAGLVLTLALRRRGPPAPRLRPPLDGPAAR